MTNTAVAKAERLYDSTVKASTGCICSNKLPEPAVPMMQDFPFIFCKPTRLKNEKNAKNDTSSLLFRLTVPFSIAGTELALTTDAT